MRLLLLTLVCAVACASPGYDPVVAGEVVVDVLPTTAIVHVEMRGTDGTLLDASAQRALTFEFPLDSGSVVLRAWIDRTGDGDSTDDLVSPAVAASQGDLDVRLSVGPKP